MSTDERVARLENAFTTLFEMVRNHDDRMNDHNGWINQLGSRMEELATAQANTEQKIAALVDAQIHTEDAMTRLATQMSELVAAQGRTDANVNTLASKVDGLADLIKARG